MPKVKVKDKFQVTIPAKIREELGLQVGDLLEADVQGNAIVLKPQMVVERVKAWEAFQNMLAEVHEKNKDIDDEEIMQDVLEAVHEYRKGKRAKSRH